MPAPSHIAPLSLGLAGALALLAVSGAARASPLEDATFTAVFTGPTHPHATSIFRSPAALGLAGRGAHFFAGSGLRLNQFRIDRRFVDPDTGALEPGPRVDASTLTPGGLIGFFTSVGDLPAHVGLSLSTPFSETFIGDESDLRYHTLGGYTYQGLGSLAFSYRATGSLYVGGSLSIGYSAFRFRFARDAALEAGSGDERGIASDCGGAPCGVENPDAAQRINVGARTQGLRGLLALKNAGFAAGAVFSPRKNWWVGVAWVSPPGAARGLPIWGAPLELGGRARVREAPRDGGELLTGETIVSYRMPQSLTAEVRGPVLPGWDLVAGARWLDSSRHQELDVRLFGGTLRQGDVPDWYPRHRGFKDVWRIDAGLEAQEGPRIRPAGRLRFETGAVSSQTVTPLQVHGPSLTAGGGAELRATQDLVLAAGYDVTWFLPLDSTQNRFDPRDRLACVDSGFEIGACDGAREGRAIPTAAGKYSRLQHAFTLSIRYVRP